MNRRLFLRGAGNVALALPWLPSLTGRSAQAAEPPRRFVSMFVANGVNVPTWYPTGPFGALTDQHFGTESALQSLAKYKQRLLFPRGLHVVPTPNQGNEKSSMSSHATATPALMTCTDPFNNQGRFPNNRSIDQVVARGLNTNGRGGLVLQAGARQASKLDTISYSDPGRPVFPETNPRIAFDDLTLGGADPAARSLLHARRLSVIDLVKRDRERLERRGLGEADRKKLDAHFTALRDTEKAVASIDPDPTLTQALLSIDPKSVGDMSLVKRVGRLHMDIIALAIASDLTRVATLLWHRAIVFTWDGMSYGRDHHSLSHGEEADFVPKLAKIDAWFADQYAYLLGKLDAIPEAGGTVLDHSAVMWINEMSDGRSHDDRDLPIVIAGGLGGRLTTGRYVNLAGKEPSPFAAGGMKGSRLYTTTAPINRLFVTLLNALGVADPAGQPYTRFGDAALSAGNYPELLT